jgi:hypothetical protein
MLPRSASGGQKSTESLKDTVKGLIRSSCIMYHVSCMAVAHVIEQVIKIKQRDIGIRQCKYLAVLFPKYYSQSQPVEKK